MELNILCFLPIIIISLNSQKSLNAIKYFISQRVASLIFIIIFFIKNIIFYSEILIILSILFKLGIPPFHSWVIRIINYLNYNEIFIILILQKFIPMLILRKIKIKFEIIIIIIIFNYIFLLIFVNIIRYIRLILFFSSRTNSLWILSVINIKEIWFKFILIYGFMNIILFFILNKLNLYKLSIFNKFIFIDVIILIIIFFNLAGFPPFLGFFIKLMIIKLILFLNFFIIIILIFLSLIIIYMYILIIYYYISFIEYKNFIYINLRKTTIFIRINFILFILLINLF